MLYLDAQNSIDLADEEFCMQNVKSMWNYLEKKVKRIFNT